MRVVPSAEHKVRGEALTAVHAGPVMSRERFLIQDADAVPLGGRQYALVRDASAHAVLRGLLTLACMQALCLGTGRSVDWPLRGGPRREGRRGRSR
jgi:hypothetical protein